MKSEIFNGKIATPYYPDRLSIGKRIDVAICTQWAKPEVCAEKLSPENYGIQGPLYSLAGIEWVVRTLAFNPSIRHLVVTGVDRNKSGQALIDLPSELLDPLLILDGGRERVLEQVQIHDWRGLSMDEVNLRISSDLPPARPYSDQRITYEITPKKEIEVYPSETMGTRVSEERTADTWVEVVRTARRFGRFIPGRNGRLQEFISLQAVVGEDPEKTIATIPAWMPVENSKKAVLDYIPQIASGDSVDGLAYTYGARLRNHPNGNVDQVANMVRKLKKNNGDKQAFASTWWPEHDPSEPNPPCLTDLACRVVDESLVAVAHFRSHDLFRAWFPNTVALRVLQKDMARQIGVELGPLGVISHSAHIYEENFQAADKLIAEQHPRISKRWSEDPRGNLLVSIENGQIIVRQVDINGVGTGLVVKSESSDKIRARLTEEGAFSRTDHALYIGGELVRAEFALKTGNKYTQDQA